MENSPVEDHLIPQVSSEDLTTNNALNFGGAATSLALILLIAQAEALKPSLRISLASASVALPLWLGLATGNLFWVSLKLTYAEFHAQKRLRRLSATVGLVATFLLFTSVAALIWSLSPGIAIAFCAAAGLALLGVLLTLRTAAPLITRKLERERE